MFQFLFDLVSVIIEAVGTVFIFVLSSVLFVFNIIALLFGISVTGAIVLGIALIVLLGT